MNPFLISLAMLSLLSGCAQEADPAFASSASDGRQCFRAGDVNTFTPRGERAVDVRMSRNRQYRLELAGYCPDVDWSQAIAIRTRGGGSWICRGMDAEIIVPDRVTGPQRCLVTDVRRLTEAEIEAQRRR